MLRFAARRLRFRLGPIQEMDVAISNAEGIGEYFSLDPSPLLDVRRGRISLLNNAFTSIVFSLLLARLSELRFHIKSLGTYLPRCPKQLCPTLNSH
jgi:hypothetical protein